MPSTFGSPGVLWCLNGLLVASSRVVPFVVVLLGWRASGAACVRVGGGWGCPLYRNRGFFWGVRGDC